MDFRTAANILGRQISTADMAEAMGASSHSVRQARLVEGAPGYRNPPRDWEAAVLQLARTRAEELRVLIQELQTKLQAD